MEVYAGLIKNHTKLYSRLNEFHFYFLPKNGIFACYNNFDNLWKS
jgi:hypothetical protein